MDNICLDVFLPSINKNYDIMVAPDLTVKTAAEYIFKTISEYEMLEDSNNSVILCSKSQKKILNGSLTLHECNIKDGSRLVLI